MILVDSSVWIDFFRNRSTPQVDWLDRNLGSEGFLVGDLILSEVLRGFTTERGFDEARRLLGAFEQAHVGGTGIAIEAARNFRKLRRLGVAVRGTVDVLIATKCLCNGIRLLHSDKDFEPFETHLGLRTVVCDV